MSLYQKVRPSTFDGILGRRNQEVVASLRPLIESDDPPHALMFVGDSGCGKTTLGRIVARALGVSDEDYREIDSADFRGVETIRDIRRLSRHHAIKGTRRCWLIDESHQLTRDASNALLKGLEDPPAHVYYVLCTTDPEKMLSTILSRCVQFRVYPLEEGEMVRLLYRISSGEGVSIPRQKLQKIAELSKGRPRAAINMLQKLLSNVEAGESALESHEKTETKLIALFNAMKMKQGWKPVRTILSELKTQGEEAESIRRYILACCSNELLKAENDRVALMMDELVGHFYDSGYPGLVHSCYTIVRSD